MTPKELKIAKQRIIVLRQRIKWNMEELRELEKVVEEDRKDGKK